MEKIGDEMIESERTRWHELLEQEVFKMEKANVDREGGRKASASSSSSSQVRHAETSHSKPKTSPPSEESSMPAPSQRHEEPSASTSEHGATK